MYGLSTRPFSNIHKKSKIEYLTDLGFENVLIWVHQCPESQMKADPEMEKLDLKESIFGRRTKCSEILK